MGGLGGNLPPNAAESGKIDDFGENENTEKLLIEIEKKEQDANPCTAHPRAS
jgi:hypothetical protein